MILSLGIAAATVTFSVVDAVILRDLPFEDDEALVAFGPQDARGIRSHSLPALKAWHARADLFEALAGTVVGPMVSIARGRDAESVRSWRVTASLFDVLRARPAVGRVFTADNERPGNSAVAVISYDLWQRVYGGSPDVVGTFIRLRDGRAVQILGVMPRGFTYPVDIAPALWLPHVAEEFGRGGSAYLHVVGRMRDGVTRHEAQAQIDVINTSLIPSVPYLASDRRRPVLITLLDTLVADVRGWMLLVLCAVTLVMLVACVSIANLRLARAARRSRELSVRASLGASRAWLVGPLVVESAMLSFAAAAGGLLLAVWGLGVAKAALPGGLARVDSIGLDLRVLGMAGLLAAAAALLFGLIPAWYATRSDPARLLADNTSAGTRDEGRWRAAFVATEVGLVAILLVMSTLFVSSFVRVTRADLGFLRDDLFWFEFAGPPHGAKAVHDALSEATGLQSVAMFSGGSPPLAMTAFGGRSATTRLRAVRDLENLPVSMEMRRVSSGYFATAAIPIVRGRGFQDGDAREGTAVIDEVAAQVLFPSGLEPIGATLAGGPSGTEVTVIGIVRHVSMKGPELSAGPQVYFPDPDFSEGLQFLVRSSVPDADALHVIQSTLAPLLPPGTNLPVVRRVEDAFRSITTGRRANATLMAILGAIALLIGTAGVYAVMVSAVTQRRRDIGVRMALGASQATILAGVVGRAACYLVAGLAIGLPAGWALSRTVASLLFDVRPADAYVYAIVAALLLSTGLIAALIPARAAARVDPLSTIRQD